MLTYELRCSFIYITNAIYYMFRLSHEVVQSVTAVHYYFNSKVVLDIVLCFLQVYCLVKASKQTAFSNSVLQFRIIIQKFVKLPKSFYLPRIFFTLPFGVLLRKMFLSG